MRPDVRALMAVARAKAAADGRSSHAAVVAMLRAWFASQDAIKADELPERLVSLLVGSGIDRSVAVRVGQMATVRSLSGRTRYGSPRPTEDMTAARRVAVEEPELRARYVLAACRRLTDALGDDRYDPALRLERGYLQSHVLIGQRRRAGARALDELGDQVLVWRTRQDNRVDPACRRLEGRLFTRNNPPAIPGAVHPRCRCRAVAWGTPLFSL